MDIIALLWALIGIVAAVIDAHKHDRDFTLGDLLISALLGLLVPLAVWGLFNVVLWRRK